jgi:predicted MFS family arabinose efflux permease
MAVAGGTSAVAWGLGTLLAARVVEGVGYLLVVVAAPDLLVRLTWGADRSVALALWGAVIPIGLAVGGAVAGMLGQTIGWRGWLGVTGVLPLLAAVAVAAAIPPDPPAAAPRTSSPRLRLGRSGLGGPVLLAGGSAGCA